MNKFLCVCVCVCQHQQIFNFYQFITILLLITYQLHHIQSQTGSKCAKISWKAAADYKWLQTWSASLKHPFQRQWDCLLIGHNCNNFGHAAVFNHCFLLCDCSTNVIVTAIIEHISLFLQDAKKNLLIKQASIYLTIATHDLYFARGERNNI